MTVSDPRVPDARAARLVTAADLGQGLAIDDDARPLLDARWGLTDPPGAGRDRYLAVLGSPVAVGG